MPDIDKGPFFEMQQYRVELNTSVHLTKWVAKNVLKTSNVETGRVFPNIEEEKNNVMTEVF